MAAQPRNRAKKRLSYQNKLLTRAKADQAAELHLMGYGDAEVAAALGVTPRIAKNHLTHAMKEAAARLEKTRSELLAEKLLQLRTVRYHAYQQFLQSTEPIRKRTKTYRRKDAPPVVEGDEWKGGGTADQGDPDKLILDSLVQYTEGRLGNNGYLQTILATVQEECDILGLYAPKDLNVNAEAVVQLDWSKLLAPPGQQGIEEPDKIQDAFSKLEGLPDATPLVPEAKPTLHTGNGHVNGYTGNGHTNGNGSPNGKH